ncbi:MAG TPA: hypothetical protein VGD31_04350 [Sphingobacteriaceae bacterium]
MKYKAKCHFAVWKGGNAELKGVDVPVDSFEVAGGAHRYIDIRSTDDISITSELEQARALQNITLYIPPTRDGTDRNVALSLTNIALSQTLISKIFSPLLVVLIIEKFSSGKILESLLLKISEGSLKNPPYVVGKQLLRVEISIRAARMLHGRIQGRRLLDYEEL